MFAAGGFGCFARVALSLVVSWPRCNGRIAVGRWDYNEPLKNALLKQSSDARAGLVCVAVGAGFQIVNKLIEEFFS